MSKLIVQFIVSFSIVAFTMFVSFLLTAAILPFGTPFSGCQTYIVGSLNILGSEFFQYPLAVSVFIMVAESFIFALISCLAYTFSYLLNNGIMVITSAFTVYFFDYIIMPLFGDYYNLLDNSYVISLNNDAIRRLIIEVMIIVCILAFTYWRRSKAKDEL